MTSPENLIAALQQIERIPDAEWLASLDERKKKELAFHDLHRDTRAIASLSSDSYEKLYGNKKYYAGTRRSREYLDAWIRRHAPGRVFLDYACGNGALAIQAARAGAALAVGIDISRVSVENARAEARRAGVAGRTVFVQADAENTRLPDRSIDRVVCSGMLHHLDLSFAFPELRRILKPGGRLLALEALEYNPAIRLYRRLTPQMRTDWERAHILGLSDLRFARRFFELGEVRYWHITSILTPYFPARQALWDRLDRWLTRIPMVRLLAWIITFELIRPEA